MRWSAKRADESRPRGRGFGALGAAVALAVSVPALAAGPQSAPVPASVPANTNAQPQTRVPAQPQAQPAQVPPAQAPAAQAEAEALKRKLEVEAEKARCTALLKGLVINATPKDPIEEGECGALAPLELVSVGKKPEVVFSPPAVVTCDLARELAEWVKTDVQPLARQHLKQPIAKIEVMSSYSCRHAYNRVRNKLSEHGKANAVDIRGFVTEKGETAYVLEDWGMTSTEIAAAAAAAQKEQAARAAAEAERQLAAAKVAAEAARVNATSRQSSGPGAAGPVSNPLANATTIIEGLPRAPQAPAMALSPSSRLGGPKAKAAAGADAMTATGQQAAAVPADQPPSGKSLFLRAVHDKACFRFGTTLGPEANAAHRNHLHVDMAERKVKKICDN